MTVQLCVCVYVYKKQTSRIGKKRAFIRLEIMNHKWQLAKKKTQGVWKKNNKKTIAQQEHSIFGLYQLSVMICAYYSLLE